MTFLAPNPSELVGAMSSRAMALAYNSGSEFYPVCATEFVTMGLIRIPTSVGRGQLRVVVDGAFGAGESMNLQLRYLSKTGQLFASGVFFNMTAASVPAAGIYESIFGDITGISAGDTYEVRRAYIPGATPNNPAMSISVQII